MQKENIDRSDMMTSKFYSTKDGNKQFTGKISATYLIARVLILKHERTSTKQ